MNYSLVLASGGIDSTACINFYKNLGYKVEALFIDYAQSSKDREIQAITQICDFYKINLRTITIKGDISYKSGLISGRNAFLYFTALMNFTKKNGIIASGIHSGTSYYDCSSDFISKVQTIFDDYTSGAVKIGTPFIKFNKKDIIEYCQMENVPLQLTYSCEVGGKQPCGECNTCKDLKAIYARKK